MEALRRKKLDRLTAGLFGLLAAGLCAGGYLAFSPARAPGPSRPVSTVRAQEKAPKPTESVAESPDPLPILAPVQAAAPVVPFKIRGVIYNAAGGSVVFIELAGKVGLYRVGDRLAEGWTIASIGLESAEFVRDGVTTSLSLERPGFKEPAMAVAQAGMVQGAPRSIPGPVQPKGADGRNPDRKLARTESVSSSVVSAVPPPDARNSDAAVLVDRSVVELGRQNPSALAEGVQFEPLMSKGQMQGFRLTP